jgi:hypothetical protein
MNEAPKFQMWAVQLNFLPERQEIFQGFLLVGATACEEKGAGRE